MSNIALSGNQDHNQSKSPFDSIKRIDREGREYWLARELMRLLGYGQWKRFSDAIQRAIVSCQIQGELTENHFAGADNLVKRPQGGGSKQEDYKLSRYAAYLIAMNGFSAII